MKTLFTIFSSFLTSNDLAACITYGIIAEAEDGSKAVVEDISTEKKAVERLVRLFESEGLEPVHLFDAVYDAIADGKL